MGTDFGKGKVLFESKGFKKAASAHEKALNKVKGKKVHEKSPQSRADDATKENFVNKILRGH